MIIDTDIDMNMIQLQVVFKLIIKNSGAAWNITLPLP